MLRFYRDIQKAIVTEYKKYLGDDVSTVADTDRDAPQPDYPYIAVNIFNTENRIGASPRFKTFEVQYHILAISDKKFEALDLGHAVRHLLFKRKPLLDMRKKRVVPETNVHPVQFQRTFLPTHFEFVDGGDFTFGVHDPDTDDTESGVIDHVDANFNDTNFHADK